MGRSALCLVCAIAGSLCGEVASGLDDRQGEPGRRSSVLPAGRSDRPRPMDAGPSFPLAGQTVRLPPVGVRPRTDELPGMLNGRLEQVFLLALAKVTQVGECGSLFTPLRRDGVEALSLSLYAGATKRQCAGWCRRGAVAVTAAGSPLISLCPSFGMLTPSEQALTLIQEAPHFAGLEEERESGGTPGAPTFAQIYRTVRTACRRR